MSLKLWYTQGVMSLDGKGVSARGREGRNDPEASEPSEFALSRDFTFSIGPPRRLGGFGEPSSSRAEYSSPIEPLVNFRNF